MRENSSRRGRVRGGEAGPDLVGEVDVGRVAARYAVRVVQFQDCLSGDHHAPGSLGGTVESFDEQHILAERLGDLDGRGVESGAAGQLHGDVLGLRHGVGVGRGGELGDHAAGAVGEQRLRPGPAHRGSMEQGPIEGRCQRFAALHAFGGLH